MSPCGKMMLANVYVFRKDGEKINRERKKKRGKDRQPEREKSNKIPESQTYTSFNNLLHLSQTEQTSQHSTTYTIFTVCVGCSLDIESLITNMAVHFSQLFLLVR